MSNESTNANKVIPLSQANQNRKNEPLQGGITDIDLEKIGEVINTEEARSAKP